MRRTLPDRGRLHIDRQLPFLCIYRRPAQRDDPGTERLLVGEASYLLAPGEQRFRKRLALLVHRVAATLGRKFGAFLIVEIWSADFLNTSEEHSPPAPSFRIVVPKTGGLPSTLERLERSLKRIRIQKQAAIVEVLRGVRIAPPGMTALLSSSQAKELGATVIGIEVESVYRDAHTGQTHPTILRNIHAGLSRALKRGIFEFTRSHTVYTPPHYQALGRRAVVKAVWEVDSRLADISDSFDFLLSVTPVNLPSAWAAFRRSRFERAPELIYRPRVIDPALMKRRLYGIPIERIEDPTIAHLFQEKQDELDRKITMLSDCGTPKFIHGSLQVFGGVDAAITGQAHTLLEQLPPRTRDDSKGGHITPETFARYATKEVNLYRRQHPGFTASVAVRDDIPGLLVSRGRLLIGRSTKIPATRAEALIHHEVGTHLLTYYNGRAQPFKQLYGGLAGYDELQEGLAVLSEFLVGGLSRPRMRTLAARVVAVQHV
ncbi:MAG: tyrosine/phenylalanine carboxypeptidase domain-containing protein, partial [Planctomycetota bacterium]